MKKFDVKIQKSVGGGDPLPAGGYVAKIMGAEVKEYSWGDVLVISFDIAEGEHKDFFATQYRNNTNEDKKWKGTYRLNVPQENNQWVESQKRTFGNAIWAIEESNPGYHWDWNETALKGKLVGVLFRNREWAIDDKSGWTTECCTLVSVDDIHNGNFKMPKDKPLSKKESDALDEAIDKRADTSIDISIDDDDLPF